MIPAFGAAAFVPSLVLGALVRWGRGGNRPPALRLALRARAPLQLLTRPRASLPRPSPTCRAPPAERKLFVRERHDGLYRMSTYLAAKMLDGVGGGTPGACLLPGLALGRLGQPAACTQRRPALA
jgi:hypothetical protein